MTASFEPLRMGPAILESPALCGSPLALPAFEVKFVLSEDQARAVENRLQPKLALDPYADPAAPYKANRLSGSGEPILNIPGQTTVLTREVLDDMNATTLRDAMRSTAGVSLGR